MEYCVIKNTVIVIDGSQNNKETMIQNASNCGFEEVEVEILSEKDYQTRLELEFKPIELPTIEDRVTNTEIDVVTLEETINTIFGGV